MTDRSRLAGWDWLLWACASVASGCGNPAPRLAPYDPTSACSTEQVAWRQLAAEPRRLADPIVPASFRSRRAAQHIAQLPPAPEVSLGTLVEDSEDHLGDASAESHAELEPSMEPFEPTEAGPPEFGKPGALEEQTTPVPPLKTEPVVQEPISQELLPWARSGPRSTEMDVVVQRSDALIRQGFRLAERGAVYSARSNFVEALGLIARSLDLEQQTHVYSQALSAGRTALVEARDFAARGAAAPVDMARIVAGHRTPVLKGQSLAQFSPVTAQQRYYTYAQEQLALAAGDETTGSMALYALGKSAPQVRTKSPSGSLACLGEQVACFQAALMTDAKNFRAANELGVILAENGRLEAARDMLERSLTSTQQPVAWRNLATVLARMGDTAAAGQAQRRAESSVGAQSESVTGDNLRWVDPATFARSLPPSEGLIPPVTAVRTPVPSAPAPAAKKRTALRLPWNGGVRR